MAFNFGAAATGVGSLADAFEANRRQALEERRQKVMDAQQAQRERYQNAYQQALIQKQQDERQYGHLLRTIKDPDGSMVEEWWTPAGVKRYTTEGSAQKRADAWAGGFKARYGKDPSPEMYEDVLYKFSGGTGSLRTAGTGKPQWKVDSGGNAYWVYPPDEQNPDGVQVPAGMVTKRLTAEQQYEDIMKKVALGETLTPQDQATVAAIRECTNMRITQPAIARMKALVMSRLVQVEVPGQPGEVQWVPAGEAAAGGMRAPSSLSHLMDVYYGTGKGGDNLQSFNVAVSHLNLMRQMATALRNQDVRLINELGNRWAYEIGGAAPTNFDAVRGPVADELERIYTGVGATQSGIKAMRDQVSTAASPDQLSGFIDTNMQLMRSRIEAGAQRYLLGEQGIPAFPEDLVPRNQGPTPPRAPGGGKGATPQGATPAVSPGVKAFQDAVSAMYEEDQKKVKK